MQYACIGFDVHQDTPVESLHTHLLGVIKYIWNQTTYVLEKKASLAKFQERLSSVESRGLKLPVSIDAEYICRFRGGLIGKHFKTLSQVMPFAINGLVDIKLLNTWLAIGRLTVMIWKAEIEDINLYTVCRIIHI